MGPPFLRGGEEVKLMVIDSVAQLIPASMGPPFLRGGETRCLNTTLKTLGLWSFNGAAPFTGRRAYAGGNTQVFIKGLQWGRPFYGAERGLLPSVHTQKTFFIICERLTFATLFCTLPTQIPPHRQHLSSYNKKEKSFCERLQGFAHHVDARKTHHTTAYIYNDTQPFSLKGSYTWLFSCHTHTQAV